MLDIILNIFIVVVNAFAVYVNHKRLFTITNESFGRYRTINGEMTEVMENKKRFKFSDLKHHMFWITLANLLFAIFFTIVVIYELYNYIKF